MLEIQLRPPSREPRVDADGGALELQIDVGGRVAIARVLCDALVGRFGATTEPKTWLKAYRVHAGPINRAAILKGRRAPDGAVTLTAADF